MIGKGRSGDRWTAAILLFLLLMGGLLVVYTFLNTNRIREALATEVMEQQHDVESLISGYADVMLALENERLQTGQASRTKLEDALDAAQLQLDLMRSNYSFERLDGAAKAHAFVKPVLEDVEQWLAWGIHDYAGTSPQVLSIVHSRLADRFGALREISRETTGVAGSLLDEQEEDLSSFRNSLIVQLAAFLAVSAGSIFLLLRQRNLQERIARDQIQSASRFREFADIGADWFWETDADLELVTDSRFSISEAPRLEAVAGLDGIPAKTRDTALAMSAQVLGKQILPLEKMASQEPFTNIECRIQVADDTYKDYSLSAKPITDENGKFNGYRGIGRDISRRKQVERELESASTALVLAQKRGREQAEDALKASEQFLRTTIDSLPQRIAILDSNGNIIETNRSWDVHEVPADGVADRQSTQRNIREFSLSQPEINNSDRSVQAEFNAMVEALETLVHVGGDSLSMNFSTGNGEQQRWYSIKAHQLQTDESRYALLVYEEITTQKKLEEDDRRLRAELTHAARLSTAGEMASGLAHELNQPLTAISHNCDAIQSMLQTERNQSSVPSPELIETVTDIAEQTQRAGGIIRSMRQMVRKDTKSRTEVDLNSLVQETLRLTQPEVREHGVRVYLDLYAALPKLLVNPVQIQQVLVNLERNSVEAMLGVGVSDRTLEISTTVDDQQFVRVCVTDSGPGFAEEVKSQLFTAFVTTKPEGMGLGLSISRSIVESHSGRLWLDRESGRTSVYFTLPVSDESDQSNTA